MNCTHAPCATANWSAVASRTRSPAPSRILSANRGPGALLQRLAALRSDTLARLIQSTQPTDRRVGSAATKVLEARRPGKAVWQSAAPGRTAHKAHDPHRCARGSILLVRLPVPRRHFSRFELPLGLDLPKRLRLTATRRRSDEISCQHRPSSIQAQGPGNERQLAESDFFVAENCARVRMSRVKLINNSEFLTSNRPTNFQIRFTSESSLSGTS